MSTKSARSHFSTLHQICSLIPGYLVSKLARQHGVDSQWRTFSPWSHVVALLYAQLAHSVGLNDVCDALRNHRGELETIRGATPPSRNGLSTANRVRSAQLAEKLFWAVLDHLCAQHPGFGGRTYRGFPHHFRRAIHVADSTTIKLVASCMDWARHRRRKAAAKLHLRLDLQSFLPRFALIDTARHDDNKRARELCAGIREGEIVVFDKAYIDFRHLYELHERGVFWVTRAKKNLLACGVNKRIDTPHGNILRDEFIVLKGFKQRKDCPCRLRRIEAIVEVEGTPTPMTFLTNNLVWAPGTIADLYKSRWAIEVFFKQLKQTLQLCDFLGHSKNAIQWQIWIALLAYVLLRFLAFRSRWPHSFNRIITTIRASLWSRFDLRSLLESYGTARAPCRLLAAPEQAYLPGFSPP